MSNYDNIGQNYMRNVLRHYFWKRSQKLRDNLWNEKKCLFFFPIHRVLKSRK